MSEFEIPSGNEFIDQDMDYDSMLSFFDEALIKGLGDGFLSDSDDDISDYLYGFQGQEKDDEVKGKGNSINYKYRMNDPRNGRFFAVDPLTKKYPFYSPYAFSGNRVVDSGEQEGGQPEWMVDKNHKLTKPVIELFHAAFAFNRQGLQETQWMNMSEAPAYKSDIYLASGKPNAMVLGKTVVHDDDKTRTDKTWLILGAHEQSHRDEVHNDGIGFYQMYGIEGAAKEYRDISTEDRAYDLDGMFNTWLNNNPRILSVLMSDISESSKAKILRKEGLKFHIEKFIPYELQNLNNLAQKKLNLMGMIEKQAEQYGVEPESYSAYNKLKKSYDAVITRMETINKVKSELQEEVDSSGGEGSVPYGK